MEKRVMGIFWRPCVALIAFTFTAIAANAQLLDGGFEAGPGGPNWTVFNGALQVATNDPSASAITAHSGLYSLNTYGPFGAGPNLDASGAYQTVNVTPTGQTLVYTGWLLNWSGAPLAGSNGFGVAQLVFTNTSTGFSQLLESPHFGSTNAPMPEDQWQKFQITAPVPAAANEALVYVLHVGMAGDTGSVWWDDLSLYQSTGVINTNAATSQPGVEISWPTSLNGNTRVQSASALSHSTVWTNFGPVWQGTGATNSITDVIGTSQSKFYQVISVP